MWCGGFIQRHPFWYRWLEIKATLDGYGGDDIGTALVLHQHFPVGRFFITRFGELDELWIPILVLRDKILICPKCNKPNTDLNNFCIQCGSALRPQDSPNGQPRGAPQSFRYAFPAELLLCPACSQPNEPGIPRCTRCQSDMTQSPEAVQERHSSSCLSRAIKRGAMMVVSFSISMGIGLLVSQFGLSNTISGALACLVSSGVPIFFGIVVLAVRLISNRNHR